MLPTLAALVLLVPSVPEGQWVPAGLTPMALAAKVDNRLATLPRARLSYEFWWQKETIGYGSMQGEGTVVSPRVFRMLVPNVDTRRPNVIEKEYWISDGRRFGSEIGRFPTAATAGKRPGGPTNPVRTWFSDFSRTILSGLGRPTHPIASFVASAQREGYQTTVNLRKIRAKGRLWQQYRLLVAKGPARYETIIDADYLVPSSVVNMVGKDNSRWSGVRWAFPKRPIPATEVAFRKPAPAPRSAPSPLRPKASRSR